eukprot:Pgem_evm2s952
MKYALKKKGTLLIPGDIVVRKIENNKKRRFIFWITKSNYKDFIITARDHLFRNGREIVEKREILFNITPFQIQESLKYEPTFRNRPALLIDIYNILNEHEKNIVRNCESIL